jgi:hypothetical protein
LRSQTKDLRLLAWHVESRVRLDGFNGALDSCRLARQFLERFGANLHPRARDGDHIPFTRSIFLCDRSLSVALRAASMLASDSGVRRFSLADFEQAATEHAVGDAALELGVDRLTAFIQILDSCTRELEAAAAAASSLRVPGFTRALSALDNWRGALRTIAHKASRVPDSETASAMTVTATTGIVEHRRVGAVPIQQPTVSTSVEFPIESGIEPSGRAKFYEKLMMVDVLMKSGRPKSARILLAELVELIERFSLEEWEARPAVAAVYRYFLTLLRDAPAGSQDSQLAAQLFERLVRLDPGSSLELESGGQNIEP